MSTQTGRQRTWIRVALAELCAQHAPAELQMGTDPNLQAYRAWFVDLGRSEVILACLPNAGQRLDCGAGEEVQILFQAAGETSSFTTTIGELRGSAANTEAGTADLVAVALPSLIHTCQRRSCYRVSAVSLRLNCVVIHGAASTQTGPDRAQAALDVEIVDVSEEGIALLFSEPALQPVVGDSVRLSFVLPHEAGEFDLVADVRNVRELDDAGRCMIGIRFCPDPDHPQESIQRRIARFVAREQREKLRRMR